MKKTMLFMLLALTITAASTAWAAGDNKCSNGQRWDAASSSCVSNDNSGSTGSGSGTVGTAGSASGSTGTTGSGSGSY